MERELYEFVVKQFGQPACDRIERRNRGGLANEKGADYEDSYAVFSIARYGRDVLRDNNIVEIRSQMLQFVDDLVIYDVSNDERRSFQLKNVAALTWRDIADDFRRQHRIDTEYFLCRKSVTGLVLSSSELCGRLQDSMPEDLVKHEDRPAHSKCIHFPAFSVNRMLMEHSEFREAIASLCVFPDREDCLYVVHSVLMGVWKNNKNQLFNVRDFIFEAHRCANPNYFRLPEVVECELDVRLRQVLDNYANMAYEIRGGHLTIKWRDILTISPPQMIDSPDFAVIVSEVLARQPQDERQLVQILLELM